MGVAKKPTINGANPSFAVRNPGPPKHRRSWQKMAEQWWNVTQDVTVTCSGHCMKTQVDCLFFQSGQQSENKSALSQERATLACVIKKQAHPSAQLWPQFLSLKNKNFS